jgi:hypothetical protein
VKPSVAYVSRAGTVSVLLYPRGRGDTVALTPDEARRLARRLVEAADKCDAVPCAVADESAKRTVLP